MVRTLPERTVDAWVAMAIQSEFPGALLWAPTQLDEGRNWDYGARLGGGKVFILEDKATDHEPRVQGPDKHRTYIDESQLNWYCDEVEPDQQVPVYYVLPRPPWSGVPARVPVPAHAAARITVPAFHQWAFVIRCGQLRVWLAGRKSFLTEVLPIPGAVTLELFLDSVRSCQVGLRVEGEDVSASRAFARVLEENASSTAVMEEASKSGSATAVFIPRQSLPNFG